MDRLTINAAISARILSAIGNGATLEEAMDEVLGDGAYLALAGEVYDTLRAAR